MKQIKLIVLVFVLMVSLTGCNNEKAGNEKNGETSVNEASEEREPAEVITFPAYEEANPEKLPFIDKVNNTPAFHVKVNLPENWGKTESLMLKIWFPVIFILCFLFMKRTP